MASENELLTEIKEMLAFVPPEENKSFALSLFIKLIYSCLVDADRLDAYLFESQQSYEEFQAREAPRPNWGDLLKELREFLSRFPVDSDIAILRQSISQQCAESGLRERGIYKLEAPTGGGKTLASLLFALVHATKHGLDRVIYVIPYLSILGQTAIAIREALGVDDEIVLEHHSAILPDNYEYYKLHTGRWDKPIILTTQVQFLESVFSARGSDLRKLHSMANSILIFDEVQTMPVNCIHLFNSTMNFFHKICKSTVLLCTATQPLLDKVPKRPILLSKQPSIATYNMVKKRTEIISAQTPAGYNYPELAAFVLDKHALSTLVVVNTKDAAKKLFIELNSMGLPAMHLSKNMCPAHLKAEISELRKKLDRGTPVICVSTQLIEAGVDISFDCVIRDIAGLDSIWQAAGRCNRHGEFEGVRPVYVVNIAKKDLSRLKDIKTGAEVTERLFREGKYEDINAYYEEYFFKRSNQMDFPIQGGSIYDLLSENRQGCGAFRNSGNTQTVELSSAIRTAAEEFYVIAQGQHEVIVPYGESEEICELYFNSRDITERRTLLRRLGEYCVSVFTFQYEALNEKGALLPEREGITLLAKGFYSEKTGIDTKDGKHEFLNV